MLAAVGKGEGDLGASLQRWLHLLRSGNPDHQDAPSRKRTGTPLKTRGLLHQHAELLFSGPFQLGLFFLQL